MVSDTVDERDAVDWATLWGPLVARNLRRLRLVAAVLAAATFLFTLAHQVLVTAAPTRVAEEILAVRLGLFGVNVLALIWIQLVRQRPPTRAIALGVTLLIAADAAGLGLLIGLWEQLRSVTAYQTTVAIFIAMAFCLPWSHALLALGASYVSVAAAVLLTQPGLPNLGGSLVAPALLTLFAGVMSRFTCRQALGDRRAKLVIARQQRRLAEATVEAERMAALARSADRAKSEFLANMSHETRTPMTAILGMMELAERTELTAEQRECVQITRSSATALLRVLDDILDLSKVEARRLELRPEPTDPAALVRQVAGALAHEAEEAQLALSVAQPGPALPGLAMIDPVRLRQVVVNLLSNAIKYTERGEIVVTVSFAAPPAGAGDWTLRVAVRDTGIGIAEAEQERIFAPFEQGDASTTRRHGGAGLGLNISRQLGRLMGGELSVESEPGVGSTFIVELPLPLAPAHTIEDGQAGKGAATTSPDEATSSTPLSVLVAEDNPVNQRLLQRLLERAGHRVTLVSDGRAAIEALVASAEPRGEDPGASFDVVLLDVQMPEADGTEVARRRRDFERRMGLGRLPLIAVTAHAMKGDRESLLACGLDGFLAKPFSGAQLARAIARAVAAGASQSSSPA